MLSTDDDRSSGIKRPHAILNPTGSLVACKELLTPADIAYIGTTPESFRLYLKPPLLSRAWLRKTIKKAWYFALYQAPESKLVDGILCQGAPDYLR